jgi:hypothetical protein
MNPDHQRTAVDREHPVSESSEPLQKVVRFNSNEWIMIPQTRVRYNEPLRHRRT